MLNSASDYRFVDVSGVDIQGRIVPTEDINHLPPALRLEDIAYLLEMICERCGYIISASIPSYDLNLRNFKRKLKAPIWWPHYIYNFYAHSQCKSARLGWTPTDFDELSTDADFQAAVTASCLKLSDLHLSCYPYTAYPSYPSVLAIREMYYALNQVGHRWIIQQGVSLSIDNPSTWTYEYYYSFQSYDTDPATRHPHVWDIQALNDGEHQITVPADSTSYSISIPVTSIYQEEHTSYREDSFSISSVGQEVCRESFQNTVSEYDNFRDERKQHIFFQRTSVMTFTLSDTGDIDRAWVFLGFSVNGHLLWMNVGVQIVDDGEISIAPLTKAKIRDMIRVVYPSENFPESVGANWSYDVYLSSVAIFEMRRDGFTNFKSELPSAWTWTPNPLTP